jgi:hypothetical protein
LLLLPQQKRTSHFLLLYFIFIFSVGIVERRRREKVVTKPTIQRNQSISIGTVTKVWQQVIDRIPHPIDNIILSTHPTTNHHILDSFLTFWPSIMSETPSPKKDEENPSIFTKALFSVFGSTTKTTTSRKAAQNVGGNGFSAIDTIATANSHQQYSPSPTSNRTMTTMTTTSSTIKRRKNTEGRVNFSGDTVNHIGGSDVNSSHQLTTDRKSSLKDRVATPYSKLNSSSSLFKNTPSKWENPANNGSFSLGSGWTHSQRVSGGGRRRLGRTSTMKTRPYRPSTLLASKRSGRKAGTPLFQPNSDAFGRRLQGTKPHFDLMTAQQEEAERDV